MSAPVTADPRELAPFLEALLQRYHRRDYLSSDPIQFVHRFTDPADREIVGLLSAMLAFGNVRAVGASIESLLAVMDNSPARFVAGFDYARDKQRLEPLGHRWIRGADLAAYVAALRAMQEAHGPLRDFIAARWRESEDFWQVAGAFSRALEHGLPEPAVRTRGLSFLLCSPTPGSARKRLAMYFRWMVRDDEIDLGLWKGAMPASALRIPLDTHLSRICRYIGLSERKTVDWKMSDEVTGALARIDPEDPVRFDFALARLGILRDCPHRVVHERCAPCPIRPVCRLGGG